jgi:hypothetical protein
MRRRSHGLQNGNTAVLNNQNTGSEATVGVLKAYKKRNRPGERFPLFA